MFTSHTLEHRLLVTIFVIILFGMSICTLLSNSADVLVEEKRIASPLPSMSLNQTSLAKLPRAFDAFLSDRLAFRTSLVAARNFLKLRLLGVSPSTMVIAGRDGWLFYRPTLDSAQLPDCSPLTEIELKAWTRIFEERSQWLANRGIRYLLFIAPDKVSVYPEFLPAELLRPHCQSRVDQLADYMTKHSTVSFLYPKDELVQNKWRGRLYHLLDTHWNNLGAFLGYQCLMNKLRMWFPALERGPASDFKVEWRAGHEGDLCRMIGLQHLLTEAAPEFNPMKQRQAQFLNDLPKPDFSDIRQLRNPFAMGVSNHRLPKAIVFRDSFMDSLVPFVSKHFSHIAYYWQYDLDIAAIKRLQPDVVIQEVLGSCITNSQPLDDSWKNNCLTREKFNAAEAIYFAGSGEQFHNEWRLLNCRWANTSGLEIQSSSADPQVYLPPLPARAGRNKYISITLYAPQACLLQLAYLTASNQPYSEGRSLIVPMKQGLNESLLELPGAACGSLRLDPGNIRGVYKICNVEIRQ